MPDYEARGLAAVVQEHERRAGNRFQEGETVKWDLYIHNVKKIFTGVIERFLTDNQGRRSAEIKITRCVTGHLRLRDKEREVGTHIIPISSLKKVK